MRNESLSRLTAEAAFAWRATWRVCQLKRLLFLFATSIPTSISVNEQRLCSVCSFLDFTKKQNAACFFSGAEGSCTTSWHLDILTLSNKNKVYQHLDLRKSSLQDPTSPSNPSVHIWSVHSRKKEKMHDAHLNCSTKLSLKSYTVHL